MTAPLSSREPQGRGIPMIIYLPPSGPPTGGTWGRYPRACFATARPSRSTPSAAAGAHPQAIDRVGRVRLLQVILMMAIIAIGMKQNSEYMSGKLDSLDLIRGGAGEEIWSPAAPLERGANGG